MTTPNDEEKNTVFGIKAKLLSSFAGMAGLTALAGLVAWYVFLNISGSVERITEDSVPDMAASLRLAEKSAEIAATAPALMAVTNQTERTTEQLKLERRVKELYALVEALREARAVRASLPRLLDIESQIAAELRTLNLAIEKRLGFKSEREAHVQALSRSHAWFLETIEPLIDNAVFTLVITGENLTSDSARALNNLVEGGVMRIYRLLSIDAEGNLVAGLIGQASQASDPALIQPIRERFMAASAAVQRNLRQLSDTADVQALRGASESLLSFGLGSGNVFELRERLLRSDGDQSAPLAYRQGLLAEALKASHEAFLDTLIPMVDDATFDLVITGEQLTRNHTRALTDLIDVGVTTLRLLLVIRAEANLVAGILNQAAGLNDDSLLRPLEERFTAAASRIERMSKQLPEESHDDALSRALNQLLSYGSGEASVFEQRRQELRQIELARGSLETNRSLAVQLGDEVRRLVSSAHAASDADAARTTDVIGRGKLLILLITGASIAGAVAIVALYVVPGIIVPLESITAAMGRLAAGDTSVDIPGRDRADEMGKMAKALGVFRDTAMEVQESNLKEIEQTRQRLRAAIESISEGFSLYDHEDHLVVYNQKYLSLLYPGIAHEMKQGMKFESIIRRAVERGVVQDAKGREEEWIAERMASHREPVEPHLQRREDGRWILISERKTEDGGTVAVYSDITDLKQHEQALAEKSQALEQLSNQLAKYLSPQVYESIFSGRQEVKLHSSRKKLTVFFSDLVGFTETADKLESEDLTALLNHYLTEMSEIALEHGATIDKYVGDAIVIFFGDPESLGVKEDALACVRMAIAMRKRLRELHHEWRSRGIEKPLECRIGINTGYCTVGNFGSETRMDYTILGGGVNLASRLESAAEPHEILISYETYALVRDEVDCEERGKINVKGIAYPVTTYSVVGIREMLDKDPHVIHADRPNLNVDMDPKAMSDSEREEAIQILHDALDKLTTTIRKKHG